MTGESLLWIYDLAENYASIGQCEVRFQNIFKNTGYVKNDIQHSVFSQFSGVKFKIHFLFDCK